MSAEEEEKGKNFADSEAKLRFSVRRNAIPFASKKGEKGGVQGGEFDLP